MEDIFFNDKGGGVGGVKGAVCRVRYCVQMVAFVRFCLPSASVIYVEMERRGGGGGGVMHHDKGA